MVFDAIGSDTRSSSALRSMRTHAEVLRAADSPRLVAGLRSVLYCIIPALGGQESEAMAEVFAGYTYHGRATRRTAGNAIGVEA